MKSMSRLATLDSNFEREFAAAPLQKRRAASEKALTMALEQCGIDRDPRFIDKRTSITALAALCEELDEQYFSLDEADTQADTPRLRRGSGAQVAFSQARAAAAQMFFLQAEFAEAIYEATASVEDSAALLKSARQVLTDS
jgi:hypothetical protein